jgi:chromosome segregation ATPase
VFDLLKDELKSAGETMTNLQTQLKQARNELSICKSNEIPLQSELNRLKRDYEKSETSRKLYEEESLTSKRKLNEYRSEHRDVISDLETKLSIETNQSENLTQELSMTRARIESSFLACFNCV